MYMMLVGLQKPFGAQYGQSIENIKLFHKIQIFDEQWVHYGV